METPSGQNVSDLQQLAVLIPVWQPETGLISLVRDLLARGFGLITIVNDGSGQQFRSIFTILETLPGVEVLHHATNLGKGRALKTGFARVLAAQPEMLGLVTADADGQHTPEDIERVTRHFLRDPSRPVLGSRRHTAETPLRSGLGNAVTALLFRRLTGYSVADTQTGLRALPRSSLPALLSLEGERYEYEMTMLIHLCRSGQQPTEVSIATVYLDGNRSSHFDPLRDSLRIYAVLLRS